MALKRSVSVIGSADTTFCDLQSVIGLKNPDRKTPSVYTETITFSKTSTLKPIFQNYVFSVPKTLLSCEQTSKMHKKKVSRFWVKTLSCKRPLSQDRDQNKDEGLCS